MTTVSPQDLRSEPFDYDRELSELVIDGAPRLFAVVQEYEVEPGERDATVAAWGLAFNDGHVEVAGADGRRRMSLESAERAEWLYGQDAGVSTRLVYPGLDAAAAAEQRAEAARV